MQLRRTATLILATGITAAGIGIGGAHAPRAGAQQAPPAGTKTVRFDGYAIDVPASWPVIRLGQNPAQCVRYDRHAVYLGPPGGDQLCPAHLVGRVETVSLAVGAQAGPPPSGPLWGPVLGQPQSSGTLLQDPADHQFWGGYRHAGLTMTATYGTSPGLITQIIRSLRWLGAPGVAVTAVPRPVTAGPAAPAAAPPAAPRQPIRGFDACTVPSLHTMRVWHRVFKAMALYIGGPEAGCGFASLTAGWVGSVTALGWDLMPTYVGLQAPCGPFPARINKGHAEAEGRAEARNAIALAASLGIGRGAPIYDDMEAYNSRRGICRRAVLSFLNGWTRALHRHGYQSGVYSSAGSGAEDLGLTSTIYGHRLVKPDSLWFALWDGRANLSGLPYIQPSWWPGRHRLKQYRGGHWRRIGGIVLNIDSDLVHGAVFR
jgi:Rv2525c-like, glycoside hydrolase-like domain